MIYLFNNQEELIKIINSPSIISLNQTETLTDENILDDRISAEVKALDEEVIQEVEYFAVKKRDSDYQYSLYYVANATTEGTLTELYGVTAGLEELDKTIIEDKRPTNAIPRVAIDVALEGTNWTSGFVGDVPNNSTTFYYLSSLEAIKKICQVWGLEAEFVIEMNGSRIGARYINFYTQLGKNEGKRVVYGHNALKILQESERTGIYTALIGRGKGEMVSDGTESESGQAGYGRRILFDEIEWSIANGDPVNKPLGQKYVELPEATATYGIKTPQGNRPKVGVVEFQEEEDPVNLLKLTYQYLMETSRPLATFETTPVYLDADIGDVIRVVRYDRHLDYKTRAFQVITNRLTNTKINVKLGDQLTQSPGRQRANLANQISGVISGVTDDKLNQLLDYLPSAAGKNTNFYWDEEPENPKVNDVWWKPNPEGEDKPRWIMRWTGKVWDRLDVTSEQIEEQFEEVERIQQEFENSMRETDNKAQQAIEDAGLAQATANTAKELAEQAQLSADNAQGKASDALDYAQGIVENKGSLLGLDSIQQSINDIENPTSDTWADIINSQSGHLYTYNQQRDATLLSSASTQTASQITNALSSYTTTDNLDGVVTNLLSNESTQTAGYISNILTDYAKQTDLTGMVTESILQSKSYITASEASQTFVNQTNLDGSVASLLSSETSQTAGSLTAILTDYVAGNIDLSGYVTETILESRNYLTASAAEQTFVKTELLDGEIVSVLSSGTSQTAQYIQDYVIGEDYLSEVIQTSDLIQSEIRNIVPVPTEAEIIALAEATQLDRADIEAMFEDGFLTQEDLDMIAELTGMTPEQVQFMVNNILNSELVQQYETKVEEVKLYEQEGNQVAGGDGTFRWVDFVFDFDLEYEKPHPISFTYPVDFNGVPFVIRTVTAGGLEQSNMHEGFFVVSAMSQADIVLTPTRRVFAGTIVRFKFTDSRTSSFIGVQGLTIKGEREVRVPIVSDDNGVIANRITQTSTSIDLALFGEEGAISRIYAGVDGLYLKGENIRLDGNVLMEQAFIRNLVASDITANTIASVSATFTNLISTNIDAQSITTQTLTALRARIMGAYTYVDISGTGIGINRYDGNRSIELNTVGMDIYRGNGVVAGRVGGANDSSNEYSGIVHVGAERGNAVSLSSKQNGTNSNWVRSLWVDGTSGQVKIGEPIMAGETGYGIQLGKVTIDGSTGVWIQSANSPNVGLAFTSGGVWWRTNAHSWRSISVWATGK